MVLPVFWVLFSCMATLFVILLIWMLVPKSKELSKNKEENKVLKGPKAYPLIGSMPSLRHPGGHFKAFTEMAEEYGNIYKIQLGNASCVVVSSYNLIKEVLVDKDLQFGGRPNFLRYHKLFGGDRNNSLALCDWSDLQMERRRLAFRYCTPRDVGISKMCRSAKKEIPQLLNILLDPANAAIISGERPIKPVILGAICNMFTLYMCSTRFDNSDPKFQHTVRVFDEIFWDINQGYAVDFIPWLKIFFFRHMLRLSKWASDIRSFILENIIEPRRNSDDFKNGILNDFTDALLLNLETGKVPLSWEHILFELEDFLGGHSAVGNLVMLVLANVALNPRVQSEIQKECDNILKRKASLGEEQIITLNDRSQMRYIEAVILETLRTSSSPIVPHVATCDAEIDGYSIPEGTIVFINNYALNVDKNYWSPDPEIFHPERFLKPEEAADDKLGIHRPKHFIPFSTGKRACVGQSLVQGFALVVIAALLSKFKISPPPGVDLRKYMLPSCVAVHPDGFNLILTPRQVNFWMQTEP